MVELPHVLVGAAIAAKTGNPALALPLALASHFVLDLIPHWNPHIYTEIKKFGKLRRGTVIFILFDSVAALFLGLALAAQKLPNTEAFIVILLGAFLAVVPDLLEAPYYFWRVEHPMLLRLVKFEHSLQVNAPIIPGIATQVVVSLTALWWVLS